MREPSHGRRLASIKGTCLDFTLGCRCLEEVNLEEEAQEVHGRDVVVWIPGSGSVVVEDEDEKWHRPRENFISS